MHKSLLALAGLLALSSSLASSLTIATPANPLSLDPHLTLSGPSFFVTNQVYETLVRVTSTGEVVPGLASTWSYPEPTTLRLSLRQGVSFHDGSPFDAAAVKASLERLLDPTITAPGRFVVTAIDEVRVVDELTVEIVTDPPFAPLLAHLSHPVTAIVPVAWAETLSRSPVGTGPYTFVTWVDGSHVSLAANASYWGGAPSIEELTFRIIPEVSTQIIELRSGGVDFIFNVPPDNFGTLSATPGIEAHSDLGWSSVHLGFNTASAKLKDVRVRQAIAHAIDKEAFVEVLLQGQALPAVAPIPPTVRFSANLAEPYPYDPERARELLAEAGVSRLNLRLDVFQHPELENAVHALQFLLAEVGIFVDVRVQEYAAFAETVRSDATELYAIQWATATLDADYTLYAFYHSSEMLQNNLSRYSDAEVDTLLNEGRNNPADDVRAEVYLEVQARVLEDVPTVTLYYPFLNYAKRERLQDEVMNFSLLDLRRAQLID